MKTPDIYLCASLSEFSPTILIMYICEAFCSNCEVSQCSTHQAIHSGKQSNAYCTCITFQGHFAFTSLWLFVILLLGYETKTARNIHTK